MPNSLYEGRCKVDSKKKDGSDLLIGKGDRQGEPFYKVSFQVDGNWINLVDFAGITGGASGDYRVEYYQKFEPNGDPELYNDKPQYNLQSIEPLNGSTAKPGGAPAASQGKETYNAGLGAYQTALNCATQVEVALIAVRKETPDWNLEEAILTRAEEFHGYLTTGKTNPIDAFMDKAKTDLGATDEFEDHRDDDMPDF